MRALLKQGPALLVGASLTDAPLLQALEATKTQAYPRYALVPIGFHLEGDIERLRALRTAQLERFQHFNVIPIYVDYFFQISQFVSELAREITIRAPREPDSPTIENSQSQHSEIPVHRTYGSRLAQWAEDWVAVQAEPIQAGLDEEVDDVEWLSYSVLDIILDLVRDELDASASEVMKIEFWARDSPKTFRGLRLWKSSVTIHLQDAFARRAKFSNHSEIAAVQAFVSGRPVAVNLDETDSPNQRWRTYLAMPVRLADETGRYGNIPVGVLVVASRRDAASSSLTRPWQHDRMTKVVGLLKGLGELLTATDKEDWHRVYTAVPGAKSAPVD